MNGTNEVELRRLARLCRKATGATVQNALHTLTTASSYGTVAKLVNSYRTGEDETLLLTACAHNDDSSVISVLLDTGADPCTRGHGSGARTPLHEAARTGRVATVRILIDAGARVDAVKSGDWTPLMLTASNGHSETVTELCAAGARLELLNSHGASPLYLAARSGDSASVSVVLNCARSRNDLQEIIHQRTKNMRTALHGAVSASSAEIVASLIGAGADVGSVDAGGMTAAHEAASLGHSAVLRVLLQRPRNGAAEGDKGGFTALHHAAIGGHPDCVSVLKGEGMLRERDAQGYSATELAVLNGHEESVEILCELGGRIRQHVLNSAEQFGHAKCVNIVKKRQAFSGE